MKKLSVNAKLLKISSALLYFLLFFLYIYIFSEIKPYSRAQAWMLAEFAGISTSRPQPGKHVRTSSHSPCTCACMHVCEGASYDVKIILLSPCAGTSLISLHISAVARTTWKKKLKKKNTRLRCGRQIMWKQMRRRCRTKAGEKKKKREEGATYSLALVTCRSRAASGSFASLWFVLRSVSSAPRCRQSTNKWQRVF